MTRREQELGVLISLIESLGSGIKSLTYNCKKALWIIEYNNPELNSDNVETEDLFEHLNQEG